MGSTMIHKEEPWPFPSDGIFKHVTSQLKAVNPRTRGLISWNPMHSVIFHLFADSINVFFAYLINLRVSRARANATRGNPVFNYQIRLPLSYTLGDIWRSDEHTSELQ